MEVSKLNLDARSTRCLKAQSSLVRRLVQARDDPAKQRIRLWLSDINDERLLAFGLTQEDIALLRSSGRVLERPVDRRRRVGALASGDRPKVSASRPCRRAG